MQAEPANTSFGKYRLLGRIAVGGMAELYKARLDGPGGFQRTFAIKRVLPHLSNHPEFVAMLVDEAKIAGLLSHANVVQILDLGQVNGTTYLAMEYVDGPDLGRVLAACHERGVTVPVPHAVFIAIEVLKGLEYAHTRQVQRDGQPLLLQIVHRDITPGNILLSGAGEVKITDFGIAKASVKALETLSGVVKGRFDYLSPEQASGRAVDAKSDLFSLGILLYEMLTGRNPFARARETDTISAIREGRYDPLRVVRPDLPVELEVIIARALEVDPARRYPSATEMKEALSRFYHRSGFQLSHQALADFVRRLFEPAPVPEEAAAGFGEAQTVIRKPGEEPPRPRPQAPAALAEEPPRRSPRPEPPPAAAPLAPPTAAASGSEAARPDAPERPWLAITLAVALLVGLLAGSVGFYAGVRYGRAEVLRHALSAPPTEAAATPAERQDP